MRIFLIVFSFINALLYFLIYAYYENIIGILCNVDITAGAVSFLKIFILIIMGFLIGLIVSLLIKIQLDKSFFDYRIALIVGIMPFIFLILSQGNVIGFIVTRIFNSDRQISELLFYFLSRQIIWALWLGFAVGASVRVAFKKKLKHEIYYAIDKEPKLFK